MEAPKHTDEKHIAFGATHSGSQSQLFCLLSLCPWTSYSAFLCLNFPYLLNETFSTHFILNVKCSKQCMTSSKHG